MLELSSKDNQSDFVLRTLFLIPPVGLLFQHLDRKIKSEFLLMPRRLAPR